MYCLYNHVTYFTFNIALYLLLVPVVDLAGNLTYMSGEKSKFCILASA